MKTIEIGDDELRLISKALDLYSRLSMGQFERLKDINSIDKALDEIDEDGMFELDVTLQSAKEQIWPRLRGHSFWGIFSRDHVDDDARIMSDMHQSIRHKYWQEQPEDKRLNHTVDAHPADICKIAGIPKPKFIIK